MAFVLPILQTANKTAGAACFVQFVLEEAVQGGLMACYIAQKMRRPGEAAIVESHLENVTLPLLEGLTDSVSFLAPWAQPAFEDFAKAGYLAVKIYKAGKAEVTAPIPPDPTKKAEIEFTRPITKLPNEPQTKEPVTFFTTFRALKKTGSATKQHEFSWSVDGKELKRETLAAESHQDETKIFFMVNFAKPGTYSIKCSIYEYKSTNWITLNEVTSTVTVTAAGT